MESSATAAVRGANPYPIPAFIGPLVRSRQTTPCPTYFEVSFLESKSPRKPARRLDALVFRNFYCSHITIKQRRQRFDTATAADCGKDGDPWLTILRDRPLMEDPHHEDDAQYWHVVKSEEFDPEEYDAESTAPISRIYLYQSSPMWKTFGLHHVKAVSWSRAGSSKGGRDGEREADGNLGDLCRGISEQVEIFGDKHRG
ncbi:unnamed protein product [Ectocarpus sp. 4 AP-2014]